MEGAAAAHARTREGNFWIFASEAQILRRPPLAWFKRGIQLGIQCIHAVRPHSPHLCCTPTSTSISTPTSTIPEWTLQRAPFQLLEYQIVRVGGQIWLTKDSRPPSLCRQCTAAVFLGLINTCCNRNGCTYTWTTYWFWRILKHWYRSGDFVKYW